MSPCIHHITEFILYLEQKQRMQQVLEKARLAFDLHEVVKAMRGWILRLRRQFCRFHLDHLKMVIVANEYQLYDKGNYIAFMRVWMGGPGIH